MTPTLAIRFAMMGGVLLFGFVTWFAHRSPDWSPGDPTSLGELVMVGRFMWVAVIGALAVLWFRSRSITSAPKASTFAIFAWSLGEMLALFGGVLYFMSDRPAWFVAGVVMLAITFVLFPGRPAT